MKDIFKRLVSGILSLGIICSAIPTFAYNAEPSELTGNMDGLELCRTIAEEGMVLLKNNGALPLNKGETIAVFGVNQIDFIYGGGGTCNLSSKNERVDYISLFDALKARDEAGDIYLYEELKDAYEDYCNRYWAEDGRTYAYGTTQGAVLKHWGEMQISQADVNRAAREADTAIVTIGRPAGEDTDRSDSDGDFRLNSAERDMINYVQSAGFERVVVILNVTGAIESDWLMHDAIDAVLFVSLPGMVGGEAMANVLLGDSYPSGKLVDTWASNYSDYPSASNFGNSGYTEYKEDIFVGYRYFETISVAKEKVNFPFGFGLSYTNFETTDKTVDIEGEGRDRTVTVTATVTNTGDYPGKEVVQVYASSPETNLTQPARELAGFYKTEELLPGESETVTITFPFDELASYDDVGKTAYEAAYVLEEGEYKFYVGNSVRAPYIESFVLDEIELVEQLEHHVVPDTNNFNVRLKSNGTFEYIEQRENAPVSNNPDEDVDAKYKDVYKNNNAAEHEDNFINFNELASAFCDGEESEEDTRLLEAFVARLTDEEAVKLTGCVSPMSGRGHRTGIGGIEAYGVPVIGGSNGPAGIQYNGSQSTWETTSTFYPCSTMQACTWNVDLIEMLGAGIGDEARHFGMSFLQGPGMNIHRDPLCGRNFEYFSEDPYVSGKMAAAITRGLQSRKVASQLKHFAFNNQELGRWGNDSRVSERAAREIYLKGYEIAVKEGDPWSIMSSYNRLNGTQVSGNYQILTEILRNEWGFDGFIMTDYRTANVSHSQEIAAGNDVKAPEDSPRPQNVYDALNSGSLERWQVLRSAERVLRFILKTEEAHLLAEKDFVYSYVIDSSDSRVLAGENDVKINGSITWGEFLDSISSAYGQTYALFDADGNEITNRSTILKYGMKLRIMVDDGKQWKDFAVLTNNLAYGKQVKASYTEGSHYAKNAVDGNYDTRWSGFSSNYVMNEWIEIDLGDNYHITRVDLRFNRANERSYIYQIRTIGNNGAAFWSDTSKNRNLDGQGYTLVGVNKSEYKTIKSDVLNNYARFINIKTIGSETNNAVGTSLWEIEVYGWKLTSSAYTINETLKTIKITKGDTVKDVKEKLVVTGVATLDLQGDDNKPVYAGDEIIITDQNGVETRYQVVGGSDFAAAKVENANLIIEAADSCIVGVYNLDDALVEVRQIQNRVEIPYNEDMKYIKVFKWNGVSNMIPSRYALRIEIDTP
ncbi:MAG: glycoside hydrolase family 3 C-terminal domain-containing protein [Clostridia bacterium]